MTRYTVAGATTEQLTAFGSVISALTYAAGDGTTDDLAALNAAAAAAASADLPLFLPARAYSIAGQFDVPDGVEVRAVPGAVLSRSSAGGAVVSLGTDSAISGVQITHANTTGTNVAVTIRQNALRPRIDSCRILAATSALTTAVSVNATGIVGLSVTRCVIDGVTYGVLTNSTANDILDVRVIGNRFVNIRSDAIEFNHPGGVPASGGSDRAAASGFIVTGNHIEVPSGLSASTSSGFGVGIAGCSNVVVSGNTFRNIRNQALHVEDDARNVVLADNTIETVNDSAMPLSGNVGIYLASSSNVTITGNTIRDVRGDGILVVFDAATAAVADLIIADNIIETVGGMGIKGGGNSAAARHQYRGNIIRAATGNGIGISGPADHLHLTGNTVIDCGGYGINPGDTAMGRLRIVKDNILVGNALGDVQGYATAKDAPLTDRSAKTTATTDGTNSATASLFRLGSSAEGQLILQVSGPSGRFLNAVHSIRWDGTTLTSRRKVLKTSGTITDGGLTVVDGTLAAAIGTGASGSALNVTARLVGTILEDGATRTGTVTPVAMGTEVTSGDVLKIDKVTAAEYAALGSPDATTLYVVVG